MNTSLQTQNRFQNLTNIILSILRFLSAHCEVTNKRGHNLENNLSKIKPHHHKAKENISFLDTVKILSTNKLISHLRFLIYAYMAFKNTKLDKVL